MITNTRYIFTTWKAKKRIKINVIAACEESAKIINCFLLSLSDNTPAKGNTITLERIYNVEATAKNIGFPVSMVIHQIMAN
jgi:hypothetical protein